MQKQQPAPPHKSSKKGAAPTQQERPTRLIRLPEVKARVGLSRSSIYLRISEGTFPAPCRLGAKSVAWSEASIDAWIQARLAGNEEVAA
jgi:prophage regulatory protein